MQCHDATHPPLTGRTTAQVYCRGEMLLEALNIQIRSMLDTIAAVQVASLDPKINAKLNRLRDT